MNKLLWLLSELLEKDIANAMVQCLGIVFYNKMSWFLSELLEKISQTWWFSVGRFSVVFYHKLSSFVSALYLKNIFQTWWSNLGVVFYDTLSRG